MFDSPINEKQGNDKHDQCNIKCVESSSLCAMIGMTLTLKKNFRFRLCGYHNVTNREQRFNELFFVR